MASNIFRLLSNPRKNHRFDKLISAIDRKFPQYTLGANTPLPNQALPTALINGTPSTLIFDTRASRSLQAIRDLAQEKSAYRLDSEKDDRAIEFLCTGYMDFAGDIIITDVSIPALEIYEEMQLDLKQSLFKNKLSRNANIETQSQFIDYLKYVDIEKIKEMGCMPVALIGTTKPITHTNDNTEYCPRFSEVARAIVPGDERFYHDIITGLITISPKYIVQSPKESFLTNGSLECILIDYKRNKNNTLAPDRLFNIVRCKHTARNGKLEDVEISRSRQPLQNLPMLSEEPEKGI